MNLHNECSLCHYVDVIQAVFIAFLVVYGILIVTEFHHNPFATPGNGRYYEICILLYISGIILEELLQVGSLFVIYLCFIFP